MRNGKTHRPQSQDVVLHPGDFYFGGGETRVRTLLGSCVSIVLWHPKRRIGGMCHYLLPARNQPRAQHVGLDGHYADEAIALFMREIRGRRTQAADYVVKLFGGGNMFPNQTRTSRDDVACRNIETARELLADNGLNIASEHVGGIGYRQLIFDIATGDVWLRRGTPLPNADTTPAQSDATASSTTHSNAGTR